MPTFTVIAGPNGSGKSIMTGRLGLELGTTLLDPDAVTWKFFGVQNQYFCFLTMQRTGRINV